MVGRPPLAPCKHVWVLTLSSTAPIVFCEKCFVQFKPANQQLKYNGIVPDRFKIENKAN